MILRFKKVFVLAACFLAIISSLTSCDIDRPTESEESGDLSAQTAMTEEYTRLNYDYMKAVWLTQYDMQPVYTSGGKQRDKEEFIELASAVLDRVGSDGFNTVIIQVRPFGDSFYPSTVYPASSVVTGSYGIAMEYDPFDILVQLAHERSLSVHAWINPFRLMRTEELEKISPDYALRRWYDGQERGSVIVEIDGRWYLNPACEEARQLIADGVTELAENYDIDGLHMDDYFYPTTDEGFDADEYASYKDGDGELELADWRRSNVDETVSMIYSAVKAVSDDISVGVSPAGNIDNTYSQLYADVYRWCAVEGYLDYICPQIYFGLEHETHDFVSVYRRWSVVASSGKAKLAVGMTLGKAVSGYDGYAGSGCYEWAQHDDIIRRCLEFLSQQRDCTGIAFFCYQYMYDPTTGEDVAATRAERDNALPVLESLG